MNGNGKGLIEINLEKSVKKWLEEIVKRGRVENREEQILILTADLLRDFLQIKSDQVAVMAAVTLLIEEYRKEVGFFFRPITEALFNWREEGREDIPEKIKKLAKEIKE